jgi:CheY-like chemotaxis protein
MGISQTALVVEDNSEVRKLTSAMLDELGYTVLLARNGVEATALLSAGEQIDFLISDYQMPGSVNGAELGALAEEIKPELKVLLCTASPDVKSRYRTLMKPFTTQDLAAALRQLERDYASRQAVQEALAGNLP